MKTVSKYVDVDVDIEDFDDEDLMDEVERRNLIPKMPINFNRLADEINLGHKSIVNKMLEDAIYKDTGRIVVIS
jgi:hypothetical protein